MKDNNFIINNAMAQGLDVVGDRWALLILSEAFLGRSRFEEFRKNTGASRTTLTRRLESLLAADVFYKRSYTASGKRFEYKLTEKGMGLFGAALLCWQWEVEWTDAGTTNLPPKLFHFACGKPLTPKTVCRTCTAALEISDVQWPEISHDLNQQLQEIQSFNKRRVRTSDITAQQGLSLAYVSDLIGDRWTLLLLIAAFFGVNRYDMFLKQLNIASNILIDRLNLLVEVGVFERVNYQENPPRSEYNLTTKGKTLYPLVMTLRQWVINWLPATSPSEKLVHLCCDKPLMVEVVCGGCGEKPWLKDVRLME
jgi:DNA-binding HxlR family transcriptional regulator